MVLLYLHACSIEGAERRHNEELAITEELAGACAFGTNIIETGEMPLCAVVLYAEIFEIVSIDGLVAAHCAKSE